MIKKKPPIVQREYILSWVWQIYYTYIHNFISFYFLRSDTRDTVAVSVAFHIHSDQFDLYAFELIVWHRLSLICDLIVFGSCFVCNLRPKCLIIHSLCAERRKKKFHEKCETWHSWRNNVTYQNGKKKCTIDTLKTNFSELVIVRVILVIR